MMRVCLAGFLLLPLGSPSTIVAQPPKSLSLAPGDAEFYSSSLRLRETYDKFVSSKAFAKLKSMPSVQMGWAMFQAQWNDPTGDFGQFRMLLDQPENQQLLEVLTDAVSDEVFLFGGEGYGELLAFLNEINQVNRTAQLSALGEEQDPGEAMAEQLLELLRARIDPLKVPNTVLGFHLQDPEPALRQIARLEAVARAVLGQQPGLENRLSRERIAGTEFLTLRLDGSLIPWDELPPDARAGIGGLKDKISEKTLVINIGVKDEYLLISIGASSDALAALGRGAPLAERKELAVLSPHFSKPVTSIAYVSESLVKEANPTSRQVDQALQMAETLVPLAPVNAALQAELIEDARELAASIKTTIPRAGAIAGVGFMSDGGFQQVTYNWGEGGRRDGSRPLSILQHVGGSSILMVVGRSVYAPESFDQMAKWCQRIFYYAEEIGLEQMDPAAQEFYGKVREDLVRLAGRFGDVTREKLIPALKDGQSGVVFAGQTTSTQWHQMLPASLTPLAGPELAIIYGVSDAALLKQAAEEYFQIAQQAAAALHRADPDRVPELQLPGPESRDFPDGTIYYYRLPRGLGLDTQVAPNAGLSDDTLILSFVPKMTARLLKKTELAASGPLANSNRPAASAVTFGFARLLAAVSPWIDYGISLSGEEVDASIREQIATGIEIAQCFRGVSGITVREQDAWVSYSEYRFQDLD